MPRKDRGRKRSVVTDTLGLLLVVIVMAASVTRTARVSRYWTSSKSTTEHRQDLGRRGFKNQFVSTPPPWVSTPSRTTQHRNRGSTW